MIILRVDVDQEEYVGYDSLLKYLGELGIPATVYFKSPDYYKYSFGGRLRMWLRSIRHHPDRYYAPFVRKGDLKKKFEIGLHVTSLEYGDLITEKEKLEKVFKQPIKTFSVHGIENFLKNPMQFYDALKLFSSSCTNMFNPGGTDVCYNLEGHCMFVCYMADCWDGFDLDTLLRIQEERDVMLLIHPFRWGEFGETLDKIVKSCSFSSVGEWSRKNYKQIRYISVYDFIEMVDVSRRMVL